MPPKIHHGGNNNHSILNRINHPIRKPAHATTAVLFRNPRPSFGLQQNPMNGPLQLIQKFQSQTRNGTLVILQSLLQVRLRR